MSLKYMKYLFVFIFYTICSASVLSQDETALLDMIAIPNNDVVELENYISNLISKNIYLRQYKVLYQFHIFHLYNKEKTHIEKDEYINGSFLKHLSFVYYKTKKHWYSKSKKLLYTITYIITPEGNVVATYRHGVFFPIFNVISNFEKELGQLFKRNQIKFAFNNGIRWNYLGLSSLYNFLCIMDNSIYFAEENSDSFIFSPLDVYIEHLDEKPNCFNELSLSDRLLDGKIEWIKNFEKNNVSIDSIKQQIDGEKYWEEEKNININKESFCVDYFFTLSDALTLQIMVYRQDNSLWKPVAYGRMLNPSFIPNVEVDNSGNRIIFLSKKKKIVGELNFNELQ